MAPLESSEWFRDLTVSMSDSPLLGVFVGTIFTMSRSVILCDDRDITRVV